MYSILIILSSLMCGCSKISSAIKSDPVKVNKIVVNSESSVNNGIPIALDVVITNDDTLSSKLSTLSNAEYFAQGFSPSNKLQIIENEVSPGVQMSIPVKISIRRPSNAMVFARYVNDNGSLGLKLPSQTNIAIYIYDDIISLKSNYSSVNNDTDTDATQNTRGTTVDDDLNAMADSAVNNTNDNLDGIDDVEDEEIIIPKVPKTD